MEYIKMNIAQNLIEKELKDYIIINSPNSFKEGKCAVPKKIVKKYNDEGVFLNVSEKWNFAFKNNNQQTMISAVDLQKAIMSENKFKEKNYYIVEQQRDCMLLEDDDKYYLASSKAIKKVNEDEASINQGTKIINFESFPKVENNSEFILPLNSYEEGVFFSECLDENPNKKLYFTYLTNERERLLNKEGLSDWYEYVKGYDNWEKTEFAKTKIESFVNDKAYEKSLPYALRNRKQFVLWKWSISTNKENGTSKPIKIPINAWTGRGADTTDPFHWATFDKCVEMLDKYGEKRHYDGIGIVLGKGVLGIDLDHCIENGKIQEDKKKLIDSVNSYTEVSPSGDGIHILAFGKLPKGYMSRNDSKGVECYDENRFFTLTGHLFENKVTKMSSAETTAPAIQKIADEYLVKQTKKSIGYSKPNIKTTGKEIVFKDDDNLIKFIKRGVRGKQFEALFEKGEVPEGKNGLYYLSCMKPIKRIGSASKLDSNEEIAKYYTMDHSRCDTMLCGIVASYTDSPEQIDRIYRKSAIMREKWDSMRGNKTYGESLCDYVLQNRTYRYTKKYDKKNN